MTRRVVSAGRSISIGAALLLAPWVAGSEGNPPGTVSKHGATLDIRSMGREIAEEVQQEGLQVTGSEVSPVPGTSVVPQVQLRGTNVQTNDPGLDNI